MSLSVKLRVNLIKDSLKHYPTVRQTVKEKKKIIKTVLGLPRDIAKRQITTKFPFVHNNLYTIFRFTF